MARIEYNRIVGMKRIKLIVAYDGTNYCGWQIQPNGITVQEVLNKIISQVTGETIQVIGASRTDSGVHAYGNVAVFDTESPIPAARMCHALNQKLPEDIRIMHSEEVGETFHPRYAETKKTYEYHIVNTKMMVPTKRLYAYFVTYDLDVEKMRMAAQALIGEHDFTSFCSLRTEVEDMVRTIYAITIEEKEVTRLHGGEKEITIRIEGNGFLYNMVRIIAGTLVGVGRGFYQPEQMQEILEAKDRKAAGVTAPPQGLFLQQIEYQ